MTTVKFDKSVKYNGVRYAAHEAFKVADEDVVDIKKAGATILATESETPSAEHEVVEAEVSDGQEAKREDVTQLKEELLAYTVPELIKFAQERGIDLQKKTKKAEIYNIIVASIE